MPVSSHAIAVDEPRIPWLLAMLDRGFPPNPAAFMAGDEQTRHEIVKAQGTMGAYLAELGNARIAALDILDFGCGWGGETIWLAHHAHSASGVDVDQAAIAQAQKACDAEVRNCRFAWSADGRVPFPDCSFDVPRRRNRRGWAQKEPQPFPSREEVVDDAPPGPARAAYHEYHDVRA